MLKEKLRNYGNTIKSAIKDFFRRKNPAEFFVALMGASCLIWIVCALIGGIKIFTGIFVHDGNDLFMDYFNSIRDVFQGTGVYTERHVIYPPMANLIFLLCLRFVPAEYAATDFADRYTWVDYPSAILSCLLFFLVFGLLFLFLCQRHMRFGRKTKLLFTFFVLINVPTLYLLERGNIVLLSTLFLALYIFTYDSKHKAAREIGLLSLAFAFSLKLYPAVLGWMLIADRRYKEAIRCIVYGILMMLLPSFFFGGPKCLVWMFENVFSFSSGSSGWDSFAAFLHIPTAALKIVFYILISVCVAAFILSSFFQKERWKVWAFISALFMAIPPLNAVYGWTLLLVPLILLCNEGKLKGRNRLYFIFMTAPFLFFPAPAFRLNLSQFVINELIMDLCMILLLALCILDTFSTILKRKREKEPLPPLPQTLQEPASGSN